MFSARSKCIAVDAVQPIDRRDARFAGNAVAPAKSTWAVRDPGGRVIMSLRTLALILLALFLFASLPGWPHNDDWGYLPSSVFAVMFAAIVALFLTRRI